MCCIGFLFLKKLCYRIKMSVQVKMCAPVMNLSRILNWVITIDHITLWTCSLIYFVNVVLFIHKSRECKLLCDNVLFFQVCVFFSKANHSQAITHPLPLLKQLCAMQPISAIKYMNWSLLNYLRYELNNLLKKAKSKDWKQIVDTNKENKHQFYHVRL